MRLYRAGREVRASSSYRCAADRTDAVPRVLVQRTEAGLGAVQLGGRRHVVPPGHALVIAIPGPARYAFEDGGRPWRFAFVSVTCTPPPELASPVIDLASQPALDRVFTGLVERHLAGDPGPQAVAAYQLLLGVVALAAGTQPSGPEDLLAARLADGHGRCGIAGLAHELGISHAGLTRRFTRRFGEPPRAFAERQRLRSACTKLAAGDPPHAAGASVGYADPAHFGRAFRRRLGLSPGAWAELPDMLRPLP